MASCSNARMGSASDSRLIIDVPRSRSTVLRETPVIGDPILCQLVSLSGLVETLPTSFGWQRRLMQFASYNQLHVNDQYGRNVLLVTHLSDRKREMTQINCSPLRWQPSTEKVMQGIAKTITLAAASVAGLLLAVSPAHASFNILLTESGGNVVATGSGSINTAGLTKDGSGNSSVSIVPSWGAITVGSGSADLYRGANGPSSFGTANGHTVDSASGDAVFTTFGVVYIKTGYVSGAPLSGSATWNNITLAGLGVSVGTYTWSFGTGANADSIVLQVVAGSTPPPPPPPPPPPVPTTPTTTQASIPGLGGLPTVPGINSSVGVLDLSKGDGPSMTTCLLSTIRRLLGAEPVYLGQTTSGVALISVSGQTISFHPLAANTRADQAPGVYTGGDNSMNVATTCGIFTVAPAVANLTDLSKALAAIGLNVDINAQGLIHASVNGRLYVVRPDFFVTQGTPSDTASLQFGEDGVLRLTDSAGKVQILRAGWYDTTVLQSVIGAALGGVISVQVDGSAVLTRINGTKLQLLPEMMLTPASSSLNTSDWVNDRPNHYYYRIGSSYQGITAIER